VDYFFLGRDQPNLRRCGTTWLMADEPFVRAGMYADVEIHGWQCGGRP
jgi:hypothetical protein